MDWGYLFWLNSPDIKITKFHFGIISNIGDLKYPIGDVISIGGYFLFVEYLTADSFRLGSVVDYASSCGNM